MSVVIMHKTHWRAILPFVLIWFPQGIQAQYFNKAIQIDSSIEAYSSVVYENNELWCVGFKVTNGYRRRYLAILDIQGNLISERTYFEDGGLVHYLDAYAKQPAKFGGIRMIPGGNMIPGDYARPCVTRIDNNGDTLWMKEYDFDTTAVFLNIQSVGKGQFLLSGYKNTSTLQSQAVVAKIDSLGNMIWHYEIGGIGIEAILAIDTLSASRYLISGYTGSWGSGLYDAWFCLLDSSGTVISQKTFGYTDSDIGFAKVINEDTLLIFGDCMRPPDFESDAYVLLSDENLNFLDTFYVDEVSNPYFNSLSAGVQSERGEYVLAGVTYDSEIDNPVGYIVCFDKNLNQLWLRKYKARNNDNYFTDIANMPDGGFMVSGYVFPEYEFDSTSGSWVALNTQDGWLVRTNCIGYDTVPYPHFSGYNMGGNLAEFYSTSRYAEEYHWDFGDGNTYTHWSDPADTLSTEPFVQHQYSAAGSYTVTLQAIACQDTTTYTQVLQVDPNNVTEKSPVYEFSVYPNPANETLNVRIGTGNTATNMRLQIIAVDGKELYDHRATNTNAVDISSLAPGLYFVRLLVDGVPERTERFIKR